MGLLADYVAATAQAPAAAPAPTYAPPLAPEDDRTGTGLFGFIGNLGADVADLVGGLSQFVGTGISEAFGQPTNVAKELFTLGFADTPVNVLTPAVIPQMLGAIGSDLQDRYLEGDIASEVYDHPLSFALDALAVAGAAGAAGRAATGTGRIAGPVGRAVLGEARVAANAQALTALRASRMAGTVVPAAAEAGASVSLAAAVDELAQVGRVGTAVRSGFRGVSDLSRGFSDLLATDRKAGLLDLLVPEPLKVADRASGYTFNIAPTRNPLTRALWSDPVRRRYFTDPIEPFAEEVRSLAALRETGMLRADQAKVLPQMEAALDRMQTSGAQLLAKPTYGTFKVRVGKADRVMRKEMDRIIQLYNLRNMADNREAQAALIDLTKRMESLDLDPGVIAGVLQGVDDGKIVGMPRDVLEASVKTKGYATLEDAVRDHMHRTGDHAALDVDEANAIERMFLDGQISSDELWRYTPDAELASLPERGRFEGEMRGVAGGMGMAGHHQDLLMSMYDSVARAVARDNPAFSSPDAVYAGMRAEFREVWEAQGPAEMTDDMTRLREATRGAMEPRALGPDDLWVGGPGPTTGIFSTPAAFGRHVPDRDLGAYVAELRMNLNDLLGPDEVPYTSVEAQAIAWDRTKGYLLEQVSTIRRRVRGAHELSATDEVRVLGSLDGFAEAVKRGDDLDAAWTSLAKTQFGPELAEGLKRFLADPRSLAGKISAEVKGSTLFGPDFDSLMRFYRTGDFTTFVHEFGHVLRRILPREVSDALWDAYAGKVGTVGKATDELFQEIRNTSSFKRTRWASFDTTEGIEISEGDFVVVKGDQPGRIIEITERGKKGIHATVDVRGVGRKIIPIDKIQVIDDLRAAKLGLAGREGYDWTAIDKIGTDYRDMRRKFDERRPDHPVELSGVRYRDWTDPSGELHSEGDSIIWEGKQAQLGQFKLVPLYRWEKGKLHLEQRVHAEVRSTAGMHGGGDDRIGYAPASEVLGGPEASVSEAVPAVAPEPIVARSKALDRNVYVWVQGTPGSRSFKDMREAEKAVSQLQRTAPKDAAIVVESHGNINAVHRFTMGDDGFEAWHRYEDAEAPAPIDRDVQAEQVARGGLTDEAEAAATKARMDMEADVVAKALDLEGMDITPEEAVLAVAKERGVLMPPAQLRAAVEQVTKGWDESRATRRASTAAGEAPEPSAPDETAALEAALNEPTPDDLPPPEIVEGPGGGPPELPPGGSLPGEPGDRVWTREMEEAFADDLERYFFGKLEAAAVDVRVRPAFRVLSEFVMDSWRKMRHFFADRELVTPEAARVFDDYLGDTFSGFGPDPDYVPRPKRRTRTIAEVPETAGRYTDGREVQQVEASDARALRAYAIEGHSGFQRALRTIFPAKGAVKVSIKSLGQITKRMQDGAKVLDALRARVTVSTWREVDAAIEALEAGGLHVEGVNDLRRSPASGGKRGVMVYVSDPASPGFVSEIEIGTPLFDTFRESTWRHDQALDEIARNAARKEAEIAQISDTAPEQVRSQLEGEQQVLAVYLEAGRRYMEGLYEMLTDDIAHDFGRPIPAAAMREGVAQFRLWVARHVESKLLQRDRFDFKSAFERSYLPGVLRSGGRWSENVGDITPDGWSEDAGAFIGGKSAYVLDDERAAAGLPAPVYYPHIATGDGNYSDYIIQRGGQGQKKLAQDKNLRRNRGVLFLMDDYIKNPTEAYAIRAARASKMLETFDMYADIANTFARRVASAEEMLPGESLIAPEFTLAFFKAVIGIQDRMGALLGKLDQTDLYAGLDLLTAKAGREMAPEILEQGIRRALGVEEREAGALAMAISEAMPQVTRELIGVTRKGIEMYAVPKVVADRLTESVRYQMGPGVRIAWDTPTAFWRAITLYGRPAWVVNNVLANTVFGSIGGVKLREIVKAVRDKEYRAYVDQLADDAGMLEEVRTSFGRTEMIPRHLGVAQETTLGRLATALDAKTRPNMVMRAARSWKDLIGGINSALEDAYRRVAFVEGVRQSRSELLGAQAVARKFWRSTEGLKKMLTDGISEDSARRAMDLTNEWFGDYTHLSPIARGVVRRFVFPFYSFYRHVAKFIVKLPGEYPGKMTFMRTMALMAEDMRAEQGSLPEWMSQMVPFGAVREDGTQDFLSFAGPNPFNVFMDTSLSVLHPAIKVAFEQISGRDAFTGREFSDPDTFTPYGSDQRYRIVRGEGGVPLDAIPVEKVVPGLGTALLSQTPQYDMLKNLVAGGRAYDTQGILGSIGNPITTSEGETLSPYSPLDALLRMGVGTSPYTYDVGGFAERAAAEREAALMQAYERWAEQQAGSPVGVG